jgi:hypothetical protein
MLPNLRLPLRLAEGYEAVPCTLLRAHDEVPNCIRDLGCRIVPSLPKLWMGGLSQLVLLLCNCPQSDITHIRGVRDRLHAHPGPCPSLPPRRVVLTHEIAPKEKIARFAA